MKLKPVTPATAFRMKLGILLLELTLPFVLYYALQCGNDWLFTICMVLIGLGMIGVILIQ